MSALNGKERVLITNARIVTENRIIENGSVLAVDGRIEQIYSADETAQLDVAGAVDAGGSWLLPGFIDVHVHGGAGADFMDASAESLDTITRFHSTNGTTAMLATTVTGPQEALDAAITATDAYIRAGMPYAQLLGVHLEGPFISPKWSGAQNPEYIALPTTEWLKDWQERFPGVVKMMTLAPEREGALEVIEWLSGNGIVAAAGHTDADYDTISRAVDHGLSHAVHTFNAMTPLHHRNPGTVGAVLTDPRIHAEIIADGVHVHPAGIKLLTMAKTKHNLILITDAMSAAGLQDGNYKLGGLDVIMTDGVCRLKEGNSLAGSTLTMIEGFKFLVNRVGVSVQQASEYASGNPARQMGVADRMGSIQRGKQADLVLISPSLNLERVWVLGRELSLDFK
ncbi:N-acetylglucosamine-6-phosphate deacetylase [Paenibacillus lutrae]|uniref:N-acetylglucosamine-6-phosphate deacetylase n=1 Tax=Paenibacillus lutrae TaxID=2078573 RepID=A0A7X3FJF3_9BACL|nr:N-acetylglucosamine-6-phosphate deacetylase [Paenibacillus lutrae]MVP00871.1 N-acetylglucosamine-6-phosphate deacetylase [Paenibacillus lutrae]